MTSSPLTSLNKAITDFERRFFVRPDRIRLNQATLDRVLVALRARRIGGVPLHLDPLVPDNEVILSISSEIYGSHTVTARIE